MSATTNAAPGIVVRASALPGWTDCPRRGAARLFESEIRASGYELRETGRGIGATIGTSVHKAAAYTLTEKMVAGTPAPTSAATDCAIDTYREIVREGVDFDRETPSTPDAERQIVRMVDSYQRTIVPAVDPIAVEEPLEADTPFGVTLTGHGDLLAREAACVRDLKTGKKRGNYKPQLGGYALLYKANGLPAASCAEDFLERTSLKKPQPDPRSYTHDLPSAETAALAILRHIKSCLDIFRAGDPALGIRPGDPWAFPANPNSMLCSAKWCRAWGTEWCHEHRTMEDTND